MEETSFTANIRGVSDLVESDTNKVTATGQVEMEGVTGEKFEILDLPMKDEELLKLRDEWEGAYAPYEGKILPIFKRNLRSYLGRNPKTGELLEDDAPAAANLQFEAEETFLAAALAEEPDPVVYSDNTDQGNEIAQTVKTMLQFHADQLILRRKLAIMVRQWSIYQLAVLKHGWDPKINDVSVENRKIQDFIFDPEGFVDAFGDFSSWLGERITVTANVLIDLFPDHEAYIRLIVDDKLGTKVTYTEWWNDDYCFTTFKKKVLEKHKNQYFLYPEPAEGVDENGDEAQTKPRNHFATPKKPYTFLSVFSLQERPHDITGLIEQNIQNQNKVSKRTEQLDANLSQSNNGIAFSEDNFNQETAKQASNALMFGVGKVLVPPGKPINEAIVRIPAPNIPTGFFEELEKSEDHLRASWGVQGIASQEQKSDTTARGMILNQGRDTSRIGGGIGDAVEQVAKNVFNWLVQMYVVFYDEPHFAAVMGIGKAVEYAQLSSEDIDRQLIVSVSPNSMKPKDEVTQMNQAIELFQMKAIGPKTLLEVLNFQNADESAGDGVLYAIDPQAYLQMNFPELAQQLQALQQQAAQLQMAAQQQQMQQEQGAAQAQTGQQLSQSDQAHQQKMQQNDEAHKQKLSQAQESASIKLGQMKESVPK